jgi:hypothetical protein
LWSVVGRRMFAPKSERVGMAGLPVRVGDSVAAVQGSKVPVVLSRKGEAREKCELAGDA